MQSLSSLLMHLQQRPQQRWAQQTQNFTGHYQLYVQPKIQSQQPSQMQKLPAAQSCLVDSWN